MKKAFALIVMVIMVAGIFSGCIESKSAQVPKEGEPAGLFIVATLFPQYDFARQIVGDKAEVMLLMPPGVETHSYEPTPADMIKINRSDLFIYTGEHMEVWAKSIIDGMDNKNVVVLDVSENIKLGRGEKDHHHEHEEDEHEEDEHEEDYSHDFDPHIWTNPVNAKIMVDNILHALLELDPENADYYKENAKSYQTQLEDLDDEFKTIVENGARKKIVFGGHFAFYYFVNQYGLDYESAYDSCSTETEPSVKKISELIKEIRQDNLPVIFYEELSTPRVAQSISHDTEAKMLLLHSCHNVTRVELEGGATYLSLMKQNAENLKEGLK